MKITITCLTALTLPLLAACAQDDPASRAIDPPIPNVPPATVLPPPSTSTPPSTVPAAPATTQPTADQTQAVIAAAELAWHTFNQAKLDPTNEAKVDAALAMHTGDARDRVQLILSDYIAGNWRSVTSSIVPASIEIDEKSVQIASDGRTATIELCEINSNVKVETGNGTDRVLDDTVTAFLELNTYQLVDSAWLLADGSDVEAFEGSLGCPEGD